MLNVTTHGEWTEIMVSLLASAMKAWKKGRSARRRLRTKCKRLERHLGPRPIMKDLVTREYTACISRASEQALIRSVFVAAGLSTPYREAEEETTAEQSIESGVNYLIPSDGGTGHEPTCIIMHVHPNGMQAPTPREGFAHVHTAFSSRQAWEFVSTNWSGGKQPPMYVLDPMQILRKDQFWAQKNIPIRHDVEPTSTRAAGEGAIPGAVRMLPLRMTVIQSGSKKDKPSQDKRVLQLMEQTKHLRSFVLAGPKEGVPAVVLSSWLSDTGTEVSQISPQAAERMWHAITIIQSAKVRCITAFSTEDKNLRVCIIRGLRLWNPDTNAWTFDTFAFINATLAAHECILGMNSIVDMGLTIDASAGTISTKEGVRVPMLNEMQVTRWKAHGREPMMLTPQKEASAVSKHGKVKKGKRPKRQKPKAHKRAPCKGLGDGKHNHQ